MNARVSPSRTSAAISLCRLVSSKHRVIAALSACLVSACAARPAASPRATTATNVFRSLNSADGGALGSRRDASAPTRSAALIALTASSAANTLQATAASAASRGPWRAFLLESARAATAKRVGIESDGTLYVTIGGLRVRQRNGSYSWSPDMVLGGIASSVRSRDSWLFVSRDGALFRAPYFTAPLERVGSTEGARIASDFVSTGRIAASDDSGALWFGSADGVRRWSAPAQSSLIHAGFVNERFGLIISSPGRLYRSIDGGARWDIVDLQGRGVFAVLPETDAFIVRAADGLLRVEASGAATPFSGLAPGAERSVTDATAIESAAIIEGPGARASLVARPSIVLPPDRVYYANSASGYRPPNDRFGAYQRAAGYSQDDLWVAAAGQAPVHIEPPSTWCRYFPWANRLVAFCRDSSYYRPQLFAGDGIGPWSNLTAPTAINYYTPLASSSDGRSLWMFSPCDSSVRTTQQHWCRFEGGRWSNVEVERRATFVAAWGDHVVYRVAQGVFEQSVPGPLRVQSNSATPDTARPPRRNDPRARLDFGAFAQDGTFYGRASIEDTAALAIGAIDGDLAIRALPQGAKDVAMADARRGLAVGERLDRVWSTDDGGQSWRPLALPLRGDPQGIAIPAEAGEGEVRVRCSPHACTIADRLVWTSDGLIGEPPVVVHGSPRAQPFETQNESSARIQVRAPAREIEFGTTRCAPANDLEGAESTWFGEGGWLREQPRTQQWEWGGHDARGAFRAASRGALPALDTPPGWYASQWAYAPRFVSRGLSIVERCSFRTTYGGAARPRQCDLVAFAPNQAPRSWLSPRQVAAPLSLDSTPRIAEFAPLPDGSFAVRLSTGPLDEAPPTTNSTPSSATNELRIDLVLRADERGTVRELRSFAWTQREQRFRGLGFDGTNTGVVVLRTGSRELLFYRSAADEPRSLGPAPLRLQPCGTERRPNTPFLVSSANDHNAAVRAGLALTGVRLLRGEDGVQSTVEFGSSGVCVRRVTAGTGTLSAMRPPEISRFTSGALVLEAQGGALRGHAVAPGRRSAMDCVPDVATR